MACGRLAGWVSNEEDLSQSPAASRAVRWLRLEGIAPNPALDWRICGLGREFDPIMDRAFITRLWSSVRSAFHEFKISRRQRRSDYLKLRDVEGRKCDRRRYASSASRSCLSTRCDQLKGAIRQRAAAAVSYANTRTNSSSRWGHIRGGEISGSEIELEIGADESTPLFIKRKRARWEIEIGEFSPRPNRRGVDAFSSSKSMEDFGSVRWDNNFLSHSASTRAQHELGETASASTSYLDRRRWQYKYRVSHSSPQVVQPVRGKLTTLASLLRTMSDRYARRTGKLRGTITPFQDRSNPKRPVLTQSQSASAFSTPHPRHDTIVDDVPMKRYDNPFRDFLRQSFVERTSTFGSVNENDRQR